MDRRLTRRVGSLATQLGVIIKENEGEAFFKKVEEARLLCKEIRRKASPQKQSELQSALKRLSVKEAHYLARAFTLYFQLVNLAEENFRAEKILAHEVDPQKPGPMSLQHLFKELRRRHIPGSRVSDILKKLRIEPVLTAHPTEARRRTVLRHLNRIKNILGALEQPRLTWRTQLKLNDEILETLEMLWQTKHVRDRRLRVEDEIDYTLHFFRQTIFSAVSEFQESLKRALQTFYPELALPTNPLQFGSWVGGDRDGNPLVTPHTSKYALTQHRIKIIDFYKDKLNQLFSLLTSAKRFEMLEASLEKSVLAEIKVFPSLKKRAAISEPGEFYRLKLQAMWNRLDNSIAQSGPRYENQKEFIKDLKLLQISLKRHHGHRAAEGAVEKLISLTHIFGFHLAQLDFRQHAKKIRDAAEELVGQKPIGDEWEKFIKNPPLKIRIKSSATRAVLNEFKMQAHLQKEFGEESTSHAILSMTQSPEDIWAFLFLAQKAGLLQRRGKARGMPGWDLNVDVVPLFETVRDLRSSRSIMNHMWKNHFYRQLLKSRNNFQEIMLGYSDSNKSGGYLSANYELYRAEKELTREAEDNGVALRFFHGKGGSIDRGGGPAHRAVLAVPESAPNFQLRITEQGEVIAHKYGHPVIAQRILEQMTTAVVTAGLFSGEAKLEASKQKKYEEALEEMARYSLEHYQDLIINTPSFITYFSQATPIDLIQRIQIGSRPVFRSAHVGFDTLRAIPWVFSWTQNRHLLSAWYGLGSGIHTYLEVHGKKSSKLLRDMFVNWPFFKSLIENVQVSLAKTDMMIAKEYATLVEDRNIREDIFGRIKDEYLKTIKIVSLISAQKNLLSKTPVLMESINLRNPYLDPLHVLQVEYLRRWRRGEYNADKSDEALLVMLLTVNGIAFGMKSTG